MKMHDPIASDNARKQCDENSIQFCEDVESVAEDADALVLCTEWAQYRDLPLKKLAKTVQNPLFLDARNFLDRDRLQKAGFRPICMGR